MYLTNYDSLKLVHETFFSFSLSIELPASTARSFVQCHGGNRESNVILHVCENWCFSVVSECVTIRK